MEPKSRNLFVIVFVLACSAGCAQVTPAPSPATQAPASTPTGSILGTATPFPLSLSYEEAIRLFDYDSTVPFDVQEVSITDQDGIAVHDILYAAHDPQYGGLVKGRMSAYLVTPAGSGPFAGVVFLHWLGNPNGNRDEFLEEAVALARKGVVALLVEGVFPWWQSPSGYENDREQVIRQVIELRRAVDLLLSQPRVDPQRIGFIGHDYGAMFGSVLAGVDPRVKAYVLMAGMGNFSDWSLAYFISLNVDGRQTYRQAMAIVDPIFYIPHAAPAALYFQFAQHDQYISEEAALQFYNAGSDPKQIQWYDASHSLNTELDRNDRDIWLSKELGLEATNSFMDIPTVSIPGPTRPIS